MENPANPTSSQQSSPLGDLTNEPFRSQHAHPKALRRTRSLRELYRRLDTSESIPSLYSSIWDADAVRSEECHGENNPNISPVSTIHPRSDLPPLPPLELLGELYDLPTRAQRSIRPEGRLSQPRPKTWYHQPTQLEPIAEKRSYASLASSLSRARLAQSPARNVNVVHPQQSHHSLHPAHRKKSPWPLEKALPAPSYHRRAFSLDDLVCFDLSSLDCRVSKTRSSNSSSDPGLFAPFSEKCSAFAEPKRPSHPSPERAPTPPGVPSFGSPEAINYFNQPRARSSSLFRIGRSTSRNRSPPPASAAASSLAANLNSPSSEPTRLNRFSRCISLFENNILQTFSTEPRRASLPAGVLQADDGTFVRGRFGGRVSGHGISSRGLDAHPMQRAATVRRERKDNDNAGLAMPRQRAAPQRQDPEPPAVEPSNLNAVHHNPSFGSLLTNWLTGEPRSANRPRQGPGQEEPLRDPHIVDVAAGVENFLRGNGNGNGCTPANTPPPRPAADHAEDTRHYATARPPTSSSTHHNSNGNGNTAASSSDSAAESHHTPFWHCYRLFCMWCCDMTEKELDGCSWYGADRPWTRDGRERWRRRQERERRRRSEAGRERGNREVSWDSVSELRRQTGLGLGRGIEGVGMVRAMRYRAGGSQESQGDGE